jgi:hypothetical protein
MADAFAALMTDVLGYPRFGAQGGDWGSFITSRLGYVEFPREILRPPRSVAARQYSDIRRWTTQPKGGHFAALEQPEVLAHEIREFFRPSRAAR